MNELNDFFSAATGILARKTLTKQERYGRARQLLQKASDTLGTAMQEHAERCHHMGEKDFLFECIMNRFDLLCSSKSSLESIYSVIVIHPCVAHLQLQLLKENFKDTLKARYREGPPFYMPALLAGVYVTILPTWFRDETDDLADTMARTDRALSMIFKLKGQLAL